MSDYSELKRLADESVGFCDVPIAPDVVLGLIYEVEGLRAQHGRDSAELRSLCQARDDARKERDQLKAEVERLKNRLEVDPRHDYDGISTRDATVKVLDEQVDQLKAENAGLKTGYEAYERVNAELKAEVEALRQIISDSATSCGAAVSVECSLDFMAHLPVEIFSVISKLRNALAECADSLHGEMLQKFGGQLPDDMHPVTRREYDRDMAEVAGYRAALGQGDQP